MTHWTPSVAQRNSRAPRLGREGRRFESVPGGLDRVGHDGNAKEISLQQPS